jgi:Glutaredoxin-like domain (DUF836)
VSDPRVVVYVAQGCHLCEAAVEVVRDVCGAAGFATVDIADAPALERAYRERIPVVAIDGADRFTYFVQPDALREALAS